MLIRMARQYKVAECDVAAFSRKRRNAGTRQNGGSPAATRPLSCIRRKGTPRGKHAQLNKTMRAVRSRTKWPQVHSSRPKHGQAHHSRPNSTAISNPPYVMEGPPSKQMPSMLASGAKGAHAGAKRILAGNRASTRSRTARLCVCGMQETRRRHASGRASGSGSAARFAANNVFYQIGAAARGIRINRLT